LRRRARLLCALALALAPACPGDPATPEARVRAVLAALEEGARERDAAALKEHVSEGYADAGGRDKRAVAALATFHFLRNRSVHLLARVREVEVAPPDAARARVVVALAGRPIPGPEALAGLRASVYRFDFELRLEADEAWRVTAADWEPGSLLDF
jgi:hypothetical protein